MDIRLYRKQSVGASVAWERIEFPITSIISHEDQQILDSLTNAVADALERKRRLGQYAVVWRDGQPVIIGEELESKPHSIPSLDVEGKGQTGLIDNG